MPTLPIAIVLTLVVGAPGQVEPDRLSPEAAFAQAEKAYNADDLLAAEKLYRRALASRRSGELRTSNDRLLLVYLRLGRPDQVVQLGLRYRKLLEEPADTARLRELHLQLGEAYLALGHHIPAREHLSAALDVPRGQTGLSALLQLVAWTSLGRAAEAQRDGKEAARCWEEAERHGLALLASSPRLPPADHVRCVWLLSDAYRAQKKHARAVEQLEPLLKYHGDDDPRGKRDTLYRMAQHLHADRKDREAEARLTDALALHRKADRDNALTEADMLQALGDSLERQGRLEAAATARGEAAAHYRLVLEREKGKTARAALAFWRLQSLHEKANLFTRAVQLADRQAEHWDSDTLVHGRLLADKASFQVLLGAYKQARQPLREALARMEQEDPPDLVGLPRLLNNLATADQALNDLDQAERHARRCLKLYQDHRLAGDLTLTETHAVLGTTAALRGEQAQAMASFRDGIALCEKLGTEADAQHSHLLLNVALLYKSQGELPQALDACRKAAELYRRFAHRDAFGHALFHAALASLYATQARYREAAGETGRLLELCAKYEVTGGLLVITAKHCQALEKLSGRDLDGAEKLWREVLALQEKEQDNQFRPRTLNYLGLVAELRGENAAAEKHFRKAASLQADSPRALPVIHYISLWRLASVLDRRGERDEARQVLSKGLEVAEAARLRLYGDARQRAEFFAQFASGFEELVDRCVRDDRLEEALLHALRGRGRAYLDQLQLSGVDPRQGLPADLAEKLLRQEREAQRRVDSVRARAQLIPLDKGSQKEITQLGRELDEAQKAYEEAWREIFNASPLYRGLSAEPAQALKTLRDRGTRNKQVLLWYWIGRRHSHLFLVHAGGVEHFPLKAPEGLAETVGRLARGGGLIVPSRDIVLAPREKPPEGSKPSATVELTVDLARLLIDVYRANVEGRDFDGARDIVLTPRKAERARTAGVAVLGDVLLPRAVRRRLQALAPDQAVVIPDGALHKFPLEALVLEGGERPRYGMDELPPLVYAPSAGALAWLLERPAPPRREGWTLCTVGGVAYPEFKPGKATDELPEVTRVLGLKGQLPRLPSSLSESRRVGQLFPREGVVSLEGEEATEKHFTEAVRGKRVVHVAAHGFADEGLGNLFGALALMPPAKGRAEGDGFVSLHEVYRLPLEDCELVVLSACRTNVGPQPPLEAGVTLAGAFLGAGARQTVASHWNVPDDSAEQLVSAFFEEVMASAKQDDTVSWARALQKARQKVRAQRKWSHPLHWAPFVLLGSG